MKKVFLFIACSLTLAVASAQVKFGVKAGANFSNLTGKDAEDTKMKIGYYGGGMVQIPVSAQFLVQPELIYSKQGWKSDVEDEDAKANLGYVNIPVLAKFKTTSGFFVEAGPQIGFLVSAKAKVGDESGDIKESFKATDFSMALGLGYELPAGFGVSARYNLGLSSIAEESEATVKNGVIQVGVHYVFSGGRR